MTCPTPRAMLHGMAVRRPPSAKKNADVVRTAWAREDEAEDAVQALFAELDAPSLSGLLLFCSSRYDLDALAPAIAARAEGLTVIGCTSSGEISTEGIEEGTLIGIGFPADQFTLTAMRFDALDHFDAGEAQRRVRSLVAKANETSTRLGPDLHQAAIFLVDGLSHREEMLTVTVQDALGQIPLIGGSSGDSLAFRQTFVLDGDGFHRDAALVGILTSRLKMHAFRSQPYVPGTVKMVVTGAKPLDRIVTEINAEPAAEEYARLVGVKVDELGPSVFAARPPMVRAGGEHYVRSVQSVNPDGSLTFYCAIDEGIVLTLGAAEDIVGHLGNVFKGLEQEVGDIDRIIGFNCVLNVIEIEQRQLQRKVSALFAANRVIGFNTYGEQYRALHVNQTFAGLAIGQ